MSDAGGAHEMPLLIGARGTAAEALLLIGAMDSHGRVSVRRWSGTDWSAVPRAELERASILLEWVEEQATAGRSMNQSLYAVRLWLRGEGIGGV